MNLNRFFLSAFCAMVFALSVCAPTEGARARFRVVVDAGHSLADHGAESARGVGEYAFNIAVARAVLAELAKDRRIEAVLINPDGAAISLQDRAEAINRARPGLIISIHHDSVQPHYLSTWTHEGDVRYYCDLFRGFAIFVSEKNPRAAASRRFALQLGEAFLEQGFHPTDHHMRMTDGEGHEPVDADRGVFRYDNLVVLRKTTAPAVLIECGIIKNRVEELVLASPATQKNFAVAIRQAIQASMASLEKAQPSRPRRGKTSG